MAATMPHILHFRLYHWILLVGKGHRRARKSFCQHQLANCFIISIPQNTNFNKKKTQTSETLSLTQKEISEDTSSSLLPSLPFLLFWR